MRLHNFLKSIYPLVDILQLIRFPRIKPLVVLSLGFICVLGFSIYVFILKGLPSPSSLAATPIPQTTHIRDRNGQELYKIYSGENRTPIKLGDLPDHVKQAVIAIEDKDFYSHSGFSVQGLSRALISNIKKQSLQGGSTITQQLVKISLLSPERTLIRKLRELALAIAVESMYTKDEILEMYLNRVGFGGSSYGIEEAARTYFGVGAKDLTLSQATLLAGLPASPTIYSPYGSHPELAKSRQKEVLRRMVEDGYITWDQAEAASGSDLTFKPPATTIAAPHFVMYIKEILTRKYGPELVEQGGLDVITSLDLDLQEKAEDIVAGEVAKVSYLHITNGAALVTNPKTGEILAMVGSKNYFDIASDGQVNVTKALRQPGSSIKPINYALALQKGFTPSSIIEDTPVTYKTPGQPNYSPQNYDNRYHGRVSLRTALAASYNVPAVKLLSANGIENMISLATQMGISTWTDTSRYGLSLTLGGGEVTMLDMATVYGTFANMGQKVPTQSILSVRDSRGRLLEEFRCDKQSLSALRLALSTAPQVHAAEALVTEITSCPSEEVLNPGIAYMITDILSDNAARAPTFGTNSQLNLSPKRVAVKTGTTNSLRDNWTIGYTSNIVTLVWVGNNDNTPMSYVASGVTGASPIWKKLMLEAIARYPSEELAAPAGLNKVAICPLTGEKACASCGGKFEYFLPGTEPEKTCSDEQIKKVRDQILTGASTQLSPTPSPKPKPRRR
ncbi:MAG: PBP1A family penicillin-binding protein [Patescibacteria group bacterium]